MREEAVRRVGQECPKAFNQKDKNVGLTFKPFSTFYLYALLQMYCSFRVVIRFELLCRLFFDTKLGILKKKLTC